MNIIAHIALTVFISIVSLFIGVFYSVKISPLFGIHLCENQSLSTAPDQNAQSVEQPQLSEQPAQQFQAPAINSQVAQQQNQTNIQVPNNNLPPVTPDSSMPTADSRISANPNQAVQSAPNSVKINVNQYDKNGNLIDSSTSVAPAMPSKDANLNINVNVTQKTNPSVPQGTQDAIKKTQVNTQSADKSNFIPKLNLPPLMK